jgi:6-phosphogluconolactonase (cycloisomerase 2 family)
LQAPKGAGPRHAVFSADEKHLYVLTELSSEVLIYDLALTGESGGYPKHPMPEFKASIIPPNIPSSHSSKMDSAELLLHPSYPRTLFASNRLELHIQENEPDLPPLPKEATEGIKGDAVAIFLLSADGQKVEQTKHVRTEADGIRGMQISTDGKYVALAGQNKGGVEIWQIGGQNGEEWKRVAKNESVDSVTDLKWF